MQTVAVQKYPNMPLIEGWKKALTYSYDEDKLDTESYKWAVYVLATYCL